MDRLLAPERSMTVSKDHVVSGLSRSAANWLASLTSYSANLINTVRT